MATRINLNEQQISDVICHQYEIKKKKILLVFCTDLMNDISNVSLVMSCTDFHFDVSEEFVIFSDNEALQFFCTKNNIKNDKKLVENNMSAFALTYIQDLSNDKEYSINIKLKGTENFILAKNLNNDKLKKEVFQLTSYLCSPSTEEVYEITDTSFIRRNYFKICIYIAGFLVAIILYSNIE